MNSTSSLSTDGLPEVEVKIPFPNTDEISTSLSKSMTGDFPPSGDQQDVDWTKGSQKTSSSSKQTSSDKLSALPTSKSLPNTSRFFPASSSGLLQNRGLRQSLDASVSRPSFSITELDNPLAWNPVNVHGRLGPSLDHSPEKATPAQRVSFESDRGSGPTIQNVRQAFSRTARASDPVISSAQRSSAFRDSHKDPESLTPTSRSPSHSRAASPLRLFQQWSAGLHRNRHHSDDPFVPVNPYKFQIHLKFPRFSSDSVTHGHQIHTHTHVGAESPDSSGCEYCIPRSAFKEYWKNTRIFLGDTVPRELYLNILLRLPAMYFSRVARIFQDAEVSKPDIQRMIESGGGYYGNGNPFFGPDHVVVESTPNITRPEYPPTASPAHPTAALPHTMAAGIGMTTHVGTAATGSQLPLPFPDEWSPPLVSPALVRFKHSWEAFIDSLLREWKTLNLVSALLLSAILTMFQIPSAGDDPITRTAAFLSLICALMSLSYGCMYIVRFGTMRSMFRAAKWAEEARKTETLIWWNPWVLLAMPAVWMSWSMVLFIASIMSFVWRTGSIDDPEERDPLSPREALGARIAVTGVFALGILYFLLIVRTLQSYGMHTARDNTWPRREAIRQSPQIRTRDFNVTPVERRGRERERGASESGRRDFTPEADCVHGRESRRQGKKAVPVNLTSALGLSIAELKK